MKRVWILAMMFALVANINAQNVTSPKPRKSVKITPSNISKAYDFSISKPLRDLPPTKGPRTEEEQKVFKKLKQQKEGLNFSMKYRNYPYKQTANPKHGDAARQYKQGWNQAHSQKSATLNFAGQDSPYTVSDCNGAAGPNHFMQGINTTYAIWDKQGNQVVAPTDFNTLFEGVAGANVNDGDPIVIYDDQANRWLAAEFSGAHSSPDYMLIAVSVTDDPTGEWYRWSFQTNGFPDYMKFGIWRDGYYMGTNTGNGDDIYVFERDAMIAGEADPQMVAFDNPNRPNSGFHCLKPLDNDGIFAPEGTPGQFITINDDAWGGSSSDQIWVFELSVDWGNPNNSTFERVQQIEVEPFDSDFGSSWDNIVQPGTNQKVDAVPQILMYRTQYRNFGTHQTIVCAHTVDVDDTDHAGIRWYELQNTGNGWSVRQQGTYAPDEHSRWMPAISMDKNHNIAIGFNISSNQLYPGIRYCGQSGAENALATGYLDVAEETVLEGTESHTDDVRWADYAGMSVDPVDDETFWFTTEYANGGYSKSTRITSFKFDPIVLQEKDAGAFALNMVSGTNFTNAESVEVIIRNYGTTTIANIPVSFQMNGGNVISETIAESIEPGQTLVYVFGSTVDMSDYGTYQFKIFTALENDQNTGNDAITRKVQHLIPSYCDASCGSGYEHITKVEFASISNPSSASEYSDFKDIVAEIGRGKTYYMTINIASAYPNDKALAWIDWNRDYDFEDEGEAFFVGSEENDFYTASITVPADASLGETVLRIRLFDTSSSSPNDNPCGHSGYGEVEDYTVKIINSTNVDLLDNKGLVLLPNPSNKEVQIQLKEGVKPININDITGKVVYHFGDVNRNTVLVETASWVEGIYMVKFENAQGKIETVELIVKH